METRDMRTTRMSGPANPPLPSRFHVGHGANLRIIRHDSRYPTSAFPPKRANSSRRSAYFFSIWAFVGL